MNKVKWLKIINPIVFILALVQLVGVILMKLHLGPDAIEEIHEWIGYAFFAAVLIHLILNWNWIKANFFNRKS